MSEKFLEKYNRELVGKNMGQFHSDFSSKKGEVLYGNMGIYVSKKVYAVRLVVAEEEIDPITKKKNGVLTGEQVIDHHLRFKGISAECLLKKAQMSYNSDPMLMF